MDKQKKAETSKEEQLPEKKKGMPDIKKEDEDDPHRGIADTPPQHEELLPDDEDFDEDDFDEELELDEEDDDPDDDTNE